MPKFARAQRQRAYLFLRQLRSNRPKNENAAPMNLGGNKARLAATTKELALRWRETKNYWKDAKAVQFERKYMDELFVRVEKTVTVIEKLDEVFTRVRKDCE